MSEGSDTPGPDPLPARHVVLVAGGQLLRAGIQALYFILIARALGSRDYGAYAGVLALVAVAVPFASLGTGDLLVKHVARHRASFSQHWGKALATTLGTGTVLLGLVTVAGRLWLPPSIPLLLVLSVGAADLWFVRLIDVSAQAYQAHERLPRTALLQLLVSPLRLVAAAILVVMAPAPTALDWGIAYLAGAVVGAVIAVLLVHRELGPPAFHAGQLSSEWRTGASFSLCLSAQTVTNDVDKAMLARLATLEATGVYSLAYRLVDMAFLPVSSLLIGLYARFFQQGVHGIRATAQYARRFLTLGVGYGVVTGVALYLGAPLLPSLIGHEYDEAVSATRWLAALPLLKAIHYFGADALTGAGYQGVRTAILVSIAVFNVTLNLWLIPRYSWQGAAAATVLSDGLMGVAIWSAVWLLVRRGMHHESPSGVGSVVETG